jgi:hypothetical protein
MKLTPIERRWTLAILDAMFPRNASDDLPLGILDLEVATYLEDTFAKVPKVSGIGMRVGFVAIALSPPVTIGKLGPIDRLDARDRVRVLEKLYQSPIYHVRQLVVLAKTTGAMLYCAAPASRAVMLQGLRKSQPVTVSGEVAHVPA